MNGYEVSFDQVTMPSVYFRWTLAKLRSKSSLYCAQTRPHREGRTDGQIEVHIVVTMVVKGPMWHGWRTEEAIYLEKEAWGAFEKYEALWCGRGMALVVIQNKENLYKIWSH